MISPPKPTSSLKRTADEAAAESSAPSLEELAAPAAEAPTEAATAPAASSTTAMPFTPNSAVKKQTAAQSLANLFSSGSEEFQDANGGGNDLVADLMGASKDAADDEEGTTPASLAEGTAAAINAEALAAADDEGEAGGGNEGPRKKAKLDKILEENAPAEEAKMAVVVAAVAAAAASMTTRRSTRAATAAAAAVTEAPPVKEEGIVAAVAPSPPNVAGAPSPTKAVIPESTPQRMAGANVLASLGASGAVKEEVAVDMKPPPALPPIAEIATAEGNVQHDYLLQNLVHVSWCMSCVDAITQLEFCSFISYYLIFSHFTHMI